MAKIGKFKSNLTQKLLKISNPKVLIQRKIYTHKMAFKHTKRQTCNTESDTRTQ